MNGWDLNYTFLKIFWLLVCLLHFTKILVQSITKHVMDITFNRTFCELVEHNIKTTCTIMDGTYTVHKYIGKASSTETSRPPSLHLTVAILFFHHGGKCLGKSAFSVASTKRNEYACV